MKNCPSQPSPGQTCWEAFANLDGLPGFCHLHPLARAVTPPESKIRFNTRFLIAENPPLLGHLHSNGELEELEFYPLNMLEKLPIATVTRKILDLAVARCSAGAIGPVAGIPVLRFRAHRSWIAWDGTAGATPMPSGPKIT